jgi:hemerythrin
MTDYDALLAEHKHLKERIAGLQALIAGRESIDADERRRTALADALASMSGLLSAHFDHEEEGGYFSEVLARRPDLSARVSALQGQHEHFVRDFAEVAATAREKEAPTDIAKQVQSLLDALAQHECDEDALLQEALLTDVGTCD